MLARDFLKALHKRGIFLRVNAEGDLEMKPKSKQTPGLMSVLAFHKKKLIVALSDLDTDGATAIIGSQLKAKKAKGEGEETTAPLKNPGVPEVPTPAYKIITDLDEAAAIVHHLTTVPLLGLDVETTDLSPRKGVLRTVQLSTADETWIFDMHRLPASVLLPLCAASKERILVGHNVKFDVSFLVAAGLPQPDCVLHDTMLMSQIVYSGSPLGKLGESSLQRVVLRELQLFLPKEERRGDWSVPLLSTAQCDYAARDSSILVPLHAALMAQIEEGGLMNVLDIESRCLPAIIAVGINGCPLDEAQLIILEGEMLAANAPLEDTLNAMGRRHTDVPPPPQKKKKNAVLPAAPLEWNWNSSDQVVPHLQVYDPRVTSMAKEKIEHLRGVPFVDALFARKDVRTLAQTFGARYIDTPNWDADTGRMRGDFLQLGGESGRVICASPNLQNLPRKVEFRSLVCPHIDTHVIIKADYSQIELRIVSFIAPEPKFLKAYQQGKDLHLITAATILGKVIEDVTPEERQLAKTINFGLIYGMYPLSLMRKAQKDFGITMTLDDATRYRNEFFAAYRGLRAWHKWMQEEFDVLEREGDWPPMTTATTEIGRRRFGVQNVRQYANAPIQGLAADGFKLALAMLFERRHQASDALFVNFVHDEVVIECPAASVHSTARWLHDNMVEAMEIIVERRVPIVVDVAVGPDWGHTKKYSLENT